MSSNLIFSFGVGATKPLCDEIFKHLYINPSQCIHCSTTRLCVCEHTWKSINLGQKKTQSLRNTCHRLTAREVQSTRPLASSQPSSTVPVIMPRGLWLLHSVPNPPSWAAELQATYGICLELVDPPRRSLNSRSLTAPSLLNILYR